MRKIEFLFDDFAIRPLAAPAPAVDLSVLRDFTWWSWLVMVILLAMHFAGFSDAMPAAIALCASLVACDLAIKRGDYSAMSVQIRVGYLMLLLSGLLPSMGWIHLVQLCGTSARVLIGYCLLHRELLLMPWNQTEPLTVRGAWRIFTTTPGAGGLLYFGPGLESSGQSCRIG